MYTLKAVVASRRGMRALPPSRRLCPHLPPSEEKNGQNQPFSAIFCLFFPLRIAFCPLNAPHKKILVPPLFKAVFHLTPYVAKLAQGLSAKK